MDKLNRRQVKVTREHSEECQKLLTLMGIPWVTVRSGVFRLARSRQLTIPCRPLPKLRLSAPSSAAVEKQASQIGAELP